MKSAARTCARSGPPPSPSVHASSSALRTARCFPPRHDAKRTKSIRAAPRSVPPRSMLRGVARSTRSENVCRSRVSGTRRLESPANTTRPRRSPPASLASARISARARPSLLGARSRASMERDTSRQTMMSTPRCSTRCAPSPQSGCSMAIMARVSAAVNRVRRVPRRPRLRSAARIAARGPMARSSFLDRARSNPQSNSTVSGTSSRNGQASGRAKCSSRLTASPPAASSAGTRSPREAKSRRRAAGGILPRGRTGVRRTPSARAGRSHRTRS